MTTEAGKTDRADSLRYARDMLPQIKRITGASDGTFLAYLLDMAEMEIDAELKRTQELGVISKE